MGVNNLPKVVTRQLRLELASKLLVRCPSH